jgi:hypothetical protein
LRFGAKANRAATSRLKERHIIPDAGIHGCASLGKKSACVAGLRPLRIGGIDASARGAAARGVGNPRAAFDKMRGARGLPPA